MFSIKFNWKIYSYNWYIIFIDLEKKIKRKFSKILKYLKDNCELGKKYMPMISGNTEETKFITKEDIAKTMNCIIYENKEISI